MIENWQTWAALAVVVLTMGVFAIRLFRKKKPGCGGGCGCAVPRKTGQEAKS